MAVQKIGAIFLSVLPKCPELSRAEGEQNRPVTAGRTSGSPKLLITALLVASVVLQSCGYTLIGKTKNPAIPENIRTMAIPFFANKTAQPEIERVLTQAVRKEFVADGRFGIVGDKSADAILSGEILFYILEPLAFDGRDNVTKYRVRFETEVSLIEVSSRKILLREKLSSYSTYDVVSRIAISESGRVEAIKKASRQYSQTLVKLVTEGF